MDERIRNLSVSDYCRIPLKKGYSSTVSCLHDPVSKSKIYLVSVDKRHESATEVYYEPLYTKEPFKTVSAVIEWYKEMAR